MAVRMFLYYALHSLKNQIKKLLRSYVIIFIAVCFVIGALIGVGAAIVSDHFGDETEDVLPDGSEGGYEDDFYEEDLFEELTEEDIKQMMDIAGAVVGCITVIVFAVSALTGDKSGNSIFNMADVNLLFTAPLKPQTVLTFRFTAKLGTAVVASVYLLFQLPNIVMNLGLSVWTALSFILVWLFILFYGRLISVFVYTAASTRAHLKKYVAPAVYGLIALLAAALILYGRGREGGMFDAVLSFFSFPGAAFVPVWGWIRMLPVFVWSGQYIYAALMILLLVAGMVIFARIIWGMKADFYEDAMARSEEIAAMLASAKEGRAAKRKKDRPERKRRDIAFMGRGASVYFFKTVGNRFRFAHLGLFTKTCLFYLLLGLGLPLAAKALSGSPPPFIVMVILFGISVFYRTLGNPPAADIEKHFFVMIPGNAFAKLFYSLLGSSLCCAVDLLPGLVCAAVITSVSPFMFLSAWLFLLSVDLFATSAMSLITAILPASLSQQIRTMIMMMFLYFGLVPIAIVFAIGAFLQMMDLFVLIAAAFDLLLSLILILFAQSCIERGRR